MDKFINTETGDYLFSVPKQDLNINKLDLNSTQSLIHYKRKCVQATCFTIMHDVGSA